MNVIDIVLIAAIGLVVGLAARRIVRNKKQGKCSCGCEHCTCGCDKNK